MELSGGEEGKKQKATTTRSKQSKKKRKNKEGRIRGKEEKKRGETQEGKDDRLRLVYYDYVYLRTYYINYSPGFSARKKKKKKVARVASVCWVSIALREKN